MKRRGRPFLAVDVGNTSVSLGFFRAGRTRPFRTERFSSGVSASGPRLRRRLIAAFRKARTRPGGCRAAVASVVPRLDKALEKLLRNLTGRRPFWVRPGRTGGIRVAVKSPAQVGADRVVNAFAAWRILRKPCIVVDFGTATTFDCVGRRGEYRGGAICPGPKLSARALELHTARLPFVPLSRPRRAIGKDTRECLRSGLFHGYVGLVKEIAERLGEEMGDRPPVIATGGDAAIIAPHVPRIVRVVPDLTLMGIRMLVEERS